MTLSLCHFRSISTCFICITVSFVHNRHSFFTVVTSSHKLQSELKAFRRTAGAVEKQHRQHYKQQQQQSRFILVPCSAHLEKMLGTRILTRFLSRNNAPIMARRLLSEAKGLATIAVVLSGCGVYDGSEVHEASAVLVSLSRESADYQIYAPDKPQMHTVNHLNGEEMKGDDRNVFVESARIARGKIDKLANLDVSKHSAVIFPGGFGAAKNLSDFALKQADCKVDDEVSAVIKSFHAASKPIGLCCIAPVLAAKVIPGCEVTMGMESDDGGRWPHAGATGAVGSMGSVHVAKDVNEVHIDQKNKIVTTPAFMCETKLHEIHDGVAKMVRGVLNLVG